MRIDEKTLETVGRRLLEHYDWIVGTGRTDGEDFLTDIWIYTNSGTTEQIEVKTIRDGKRPYKNPKYIKDYTDESWGDGNFWLLNKSCDGGKSKWEKFVDKEYSGLVFYLEKEKELIIYSWSELMTAYKGDCKLYVRHTTDLGDRRWQWEDKVMIDMNKGKHIAL